MATARLTISSPSPGYSGWEITISNITDTDQVKDKTKYLNSTVTAVSPITGSLFLIQSSSGSNKIEGYSNGSGVEYVTWRSTSPVGQHPTSGFSLDLWSTSLYTSVITNSANWNTLAGSTYALDTNFHSLVYSYSNLYSPLYSKGGTLSISIEA